MNTGEFAPIWEAIRNLLYEHDCVIVPGFGGFVCNREPARIDQVTHVILPPGKHLVFNQNIKTNDGLLAGHLVQAQALTYADALKSIETFVVNLVQVLQDKKQYTVDAFGSFRLNAEANYVFLPERQNNYLYSSYGLQPMQAEYIAGGYARLKKRTRIFRDYKPVAKARTGRVRNAWPKVLAATLTLLLFVNGWIFFQDHQMSDLRIGNASLNVSSWFDSIFTQPEQPTPPVTVNAPSTPLPTPEPEVVAEPVVVDSTLTTEVVDTITAQEDATKQFDAFVQAFAAVRGTVYVPGVSLDMVEIAPGIEATPEVPATTEPAVQSEEVTTAGYYIIGGVFCKQRNAKHFKALLIEKGYHAAMILNPTINCQRVSYASFTSKSEAEHMLKEIKATENPDAWLLEIPQ